MNYRVFNESYGEELPQEGIGILVLIVGKTDPGRGRITEFSMRVMATNPRSNGRRKR